MKKTMAWWMLCLAGAAHAHEGHGLAGSSHWHATDALGYVLAAVAGLGLALWFNRNK